MKVVLFMLDSKTIMLNPHHNLEFLCGIKDFQMVSDQSKFKSHQCKFNCGLKENFSTHT